MHLSFLSGSSGCSFQLILSYLSFKLARMQIFMKTSGLKVLVTLLLVSASSSQVLAESTVWSRTAPIGEVCVEGDPCAKELVMVASTAVAPSQQGGLAKVSLSAGSEHEVKMLNMSSEGSMVFEPPVLKVSVGDTIHFKSVDLSHNSASIAGMIPDGASSWSGGMNQDISVTLNTEGVYVYQCDPHAMMAMVGVIQVGNPVNLEAVKAQAGSKKSGFVMNQSRLDDYLSQR